jgi:hypothetical protein
MRAKVDSQVAAPAEMKDAQLAPSESIAHQRVRMEGWRQRRPGSTEKISDKKKKKPSWPIPLPVIRKAFFLSRHPEQGRIRFMIVNAIQDSR